ncbi:hypothetical protein ADL22_22025 [Streptomyces sp. NRRL F-4489]|uniref:DUF885 domain-containing protein n=1 Tax=Streptomyces sp. NRRL F-4489 TaxID=1609095 RepID=UPI00074A41B3|nr:DUF885 domain-containing protein [Streptomyces sp. NRRL F-4489]KUL37348.1 hypothetical protein ADL22_22025 [Streptomyces sp. NRRL F-4489]
MTALDDLAASYSGEFARLDPCQAAMMGIAGEEAALTDYGPGGWAARAGLARRTLAALAGVPVDGERDRIAARVLRERLEVELALDGAGIPDADVNVVDGPLQRLRQAVELLDQGERTRWPDVTARLRGIPAALAGHRESLAAARREGRVAARRQIAGTAGQCAETARYFGELAGRCPDGAPRREAERAARDAGAALTAFAAFLTGELLPYAPERDAVGRDRYALEVRRHLGAELDLAETYAWGWEELARIEREMAQLAGEILPGEPLPAVFAALDADPAHQVRGAEAFRRHLQELADRAVDELDGTHFDIPPALRRIECRIPPTGAGGIYYLAPTEDLSRPGQVWWTVPGPDAVIPTWTVPATMYHEGVPGHHLQLGGTVLNPALTRFQRVASELHVGHAEGWGLYAERLMAELGYFRHPAHRLGALASGQQLRAARVVLDIGLHLELEIPRGTGFHEGERWTRELGREFLGSRVPEGGAYLDFEIDRYLGLPGQALAYKVGERVWLEGRRAQRRAKGAAFDPKAFHRDALALGPMGLDLLAAELARL